MLRRLFPRVSRPAVLLIAPALLAMLLVGCGGSSDDDIVVTVVMPSETASPTATQTATRTPQPPTPTPTEEPRAEVIQSLRALVNDYGYPEDATFARIRIPSLSVESQVSARYVGTDGVMASPVGPADVIWYDMDAWNGMGGAPGSGGNAIFSGHVDYAANVRYAGVYYRGQGVFSQLGLLSGGDIIEIDYNGQTLRYAVVWRQQLGAEDTSWGNIWSDDVPVDSITLYTCGGDFDFNSLEYSDRVVVRAERIS